MRSVSTCVLCDIELLEEEYEDGLCAHCTSRTIAVVKPVPGKKKRKYDDDPRSSYSHKKHIDKPTKTRYNASVRERKER